MANWSTFSENHRSHVIQQKCISTYVVSSKTWLHCSIEGSSDFFSILRAAWVSLSLFKAPLLLLCLCSRFLLFLGLDGVKEAPESNKISIGDFSWWVVDDPISSPTNPSQDGPYASFLTVDMPTNNVVTVNVIHSLETKLVLPPDCSVWQTYIAV